MAVEKTNPKDLALLRALMTECRDDLAILEQTGWTVEYLMLLKDALFAEEERTLLSARSEEVYVDYVVRTRANIRRLGELYETLKDSNQGSAAVGAVKASQDLMDRIIARGQELGFIDKRPEGKMVVLARLDDRALVEKLSTEMAGVRNLMARYGDVPFLDVSFTEAPSLPPPKRPREEESVEPQKGMKRSRGGEFSPPEVKRTPVRKREDETDS